MKRIALFLLALGSLIPAHAAVVTLQVTLGSGNTTILSPGAHQRCAWFIIQNNAIHVIRVGDTNISSTRGLSINAGGASFYVGPASTGSGRDLGTWYINGTNGDVIDVIYDDGQ